MAIDSQGDADDIWAVRTLPTRMQTARWAVWLGADPFEYVGLMSLVDNY